MAENYLVWVGGWSNPRTIIERDGKVSLEIALTHDHCPTCASRVRHVTETLSRRNVQYNWSYPCGPSSFITVDAPGEGLPTKKYLADLLGLEIH